MPEYILRLLGEGKNRSEAEALELRVDGNIPKKDDIFTLDKEYPACIVTYRVMDVSPINIKIPKNEPISQIYQADTQVVSALREPGGFKKK